MEKGAILTDESRWLKGSPKERLDQHGRETRPSDCLHYVVALSRAEETHLIPEVIRESICAKLFVLTSGVRFISSVFCDNLVASL